MRELEAGTLASGKDSAKASLNLATIPRETSGLIHISRAAFLRVVELLHIDPYVLRLVLVTMILNPTTPLMLTTLGTSSIP